MTKQHEDLWIRVASGLISQGLGHRLSNLPPDGDLREMVVEAMGIADTAIAELRARGAKRATKRVARPKVSR